MAASERIQIALDSLRGYLRQTGAAKARWDAVIKLESELERLRDLAEKGREDSRRMEKVEREHEKALERKDKEIARAQAEITRLEQIEVQTRALRDDPDAIIASKAQLDQLHAEGALLKRARKLLELPT